MTTVNSLSGGKTSSYIAANFPADYEVFSLVCIDDFECKPKDKAVIEYVNQKLSEYADKYGEFIATAEDDQTLCCMMDLEQFIGREIVWVRGKSFDDVIDTGTHTRLPSWARRYCTEQMKIEPIFYWWLKTIGEKCNMRIGFRFDEYDRMERFFNSSNPTQYRIPTSTSLFGEKRQKHEDFDWRYCSFPLLKHGIKKTDIDQFWKEKGFVSRSLFAPIEPIVWPAISNCVGCFHKKVETLAAMAHLQPKKMNWFANQELKEKKGKSMGKWLDSKQSYHDIIQNKESLVKEVLIEMKLTGQSCDTGGCTD